MGDWVAGTGVDTVQKELGLKLRLVLKLLKAGAEPEDGRMVAVAAVSEPLCLMVGGGGQWHNRGHW